MGKEFSTQAVHAGEVRRKPAGAITTPIVQTSTYTYESTAEILDYLHSKVAREQALASGGDLRLRDEYGRYSNPTQSAVEQKLATLEGGEKALLFASGMCAITTTMLTLLSQGDHLIMVSGCYRRTQDFAKQYLSRWGIETSIVPIDQLDQLAAAIRPRTRLIFSESPTNPYLRILDIPRMVESAREYGVMTMIDSTFATPLNLQPLTLGVDLVMHSATKYLGGHNDLLAGTVIGSSKVLAQIENARGVLGGVSGPHDAYLLLRGIKTLDLRVRRQNQNGLELAQFLEGHPAVKNVYYPGLPSHPDHEIASRLMSGFGGVVSFDIDGDMEKTSRFVDRLQLPYVGPTLGGVESIVQQQSIFISLDAEVRQASGIEDTLVRYAIGVENAADLIADLEQALEVIS